LKRAALGAAALIGLLLPALSGSALFGFRDMLHNYLPMKALFWQGSSWTWNSFAFGGSSLLADLVQQPFYLPNLLFRWLHVPAVPGIAWFLFLHLLFGMWAMAALARRIAPGSEEIAAIAFGLCGFTLANSGANLQWACAAAWVPFALLAAARLRESGELPDAALLGIALPQVLLAGDPLLCAALCAACALISRKRVLLVALCTALLAAPQVYATLRALPLFTRGAGFPMAEREQWSLHAARLAELFVPRLFGPLFSDGFWGGFTVSPPWKRSWAHSIYFGVLTPALIAFAVRRREARPWIALCLAALALVLGSHFFHLYGLLTSLPVLSGFRYPERLLALFVPPFSLLLALGAQGLLRSPRRSWFALGSAVLALGALLVTALFATPDRSAVVRSAAQIALAGACFALALRAPRGAPLLVAGVLCADLSAANGELLGLIPRDALSREPAACAAIDRASGGAPRGSFRVYVDQESLERPAADWQAQREREWSFGKRNLLELCGFRESAALTSLDPRAAREVWTGAGPLAALRALGTRFIVTSPAHSERFGGKPMAGVPGSFVVLELPALPLVFREQGGAAAIDPRFDASRISFRASQAQAGNWIVSATLDEDWRALVDGAPADILDSNLVRRAIWLPAGEHRVELMHRPVKPLAVFALSLLVTLLLALQASRRTPGAAI
jgi:hypothetical protein